MDVTALPHRTLAIVRGSDPKAALRTVLILAEQGLTASEVSLTTPDALWVIEQARRELGPDALVGAGTVVTAADAAHAADAGADFLVTPGLGSDLREARPSRLPVFVGALTPAEVIEALAYGATAVKLFPASLGGPPYLKALRDPFPTVPFVPVGGVDAEAAAAFLADGAAAVGVGSPLIGDAASGGDHDGLRTRAAAWRLRMAEAVGA